MISFNFLCYNKAMNKNTTQNGNAIALILIAVALFAALGYAFSNTSRTSTSFITDEEVHAYANQIIAYGTDVKSAVQRLQLRGCDDTQINFENSISLINYTNTTPSPTDRSCHVFDNNGGGLQFQQPNNTASEPNFIGNLAITGHGETCADATCSDLFIAIELSNTANTAAQADRICANINEKLGHSATLKDETFGDDTQTSPPWQFTGTYNYADTINVTEINGLKNYCVRSTGADNITYHQILIAR